MFYGNLALDDERSVDRDTVQYRTRLIGPDAQQISVLIVNISACGLMMRCDTELAEGDSVEISLPKLGNIDAEVRWWLGGRMGCQFRQVIDRAQYFDMLSALVRLS
ncbi:hypothetical protein GCM10023219_26180 [Stakelama sediminis]|uniref:PilZ domain-containing protein n=1 Tax=Stakelama sediminis TaxID=463200 RepID=A0A840YYT6_9SPHN|nr:PilZ domain-containing protein [Stakelama sediminis]MBB5718699.1 hypothetical protein [Stakelama sediminis]